MSGSESQRIDKWLWHARFARTRGAAQELARSGHVRVNRDKVREASRLVRPGDVLTLGLRRGVQVIRILALADRRGSFEEARLLYEAGAAESDRVPSGPAGEE
jgi:ribosome-associated heat shock protein Hsp15